MRLLLALALIFFSGQEARTPGPGGIPTPASPVPAITTFGFGSSGVGSPTASWTQPAGTVLLDVHLFTNTGSATISTLKDCAGTGACGGASTDTFSVANACSTFNTRTICESYTCSSALAAGAASITFHPSVAGTTTIVEVEVITGALASSCLDKVGIGGNTTANPSVTIGGGPIAFTNELITAAVGSTVASPLAGTGYTLVNTNGGWATERSLVAPTIGGSATAAFSQSASSWEMEMSTWRSN